MSKCVSYRHSYLHLALNVIKVYIMQIEIERKFKVTDFHAPLEELKELGANFESSKVTEDVYFKISQRVKNDRYLRIRRNGNDKNGSLAYHEVPDDNITEEWETEVSEFEITKKLIQKLGFSIDVTVIKKRDKYKLDGEQILLDEVKGLGLFIEIEATSMENLKGLIKKLNLKEKNIISGAGYPDLLKDAIKFK